MDVLHFQREGIPVGTDREAALWNRNDPVKSGRRNGGMKIVNLIRGNRRSPEQRESYMCESTLLRSSASPILSLHHTVVSRRTAKSDPVSLTVRAHAREGAAASDSPFEMVDMRRFKIWTRGLIVTTIFIQPRNRVRIGAAIGGHWLLFMWREVRGVNCEWEQSQRARFQDLSATVKKKRFAMRGHGCRPPLKELRMAHYSPAPPQFRSLAG